MSRNLSFRFDLLRKGGYYARLRALLDQDPIIRCDDSGEKKMSMTGVFAAVAEDVDGNPVEADWLTDEVQPVMIEDGAESSLGIFLPTKPEDYTRPGVAYQTIQFFDRCWRVENTKSSQTVYAAAGSRYIDVIKQRLAASGIATVFAVDSDAVLSADREWPAGTSNLEIVNKLLKEISYKELWFDQNGAARLEPYAVPTLASVKASFDVNDPETKIVPGITRSTDLYDAPNVWIVTCANPDTGEIWTKTARNENPQSPLSVPRRGREICRLVQANDIPTEAALRIYTDRLRDESMTGCETIRFSTGLRAGFGVGDAVAFNDGDSISVCIAHSWEMELKVGGQMNFTLERMVYNLDP